MHKTEIDGAVILEPQEASAVPADTNQLHGPIIRDVTAADLTDLVDISKKLPVVVFVYQPGVEPCIELQPVLEELVRELDGRVVLAKLDILAHAQVAQALHVQSVPAVTAIVNGQPLPMFQGLQPRENVVAVFNELLNIAAQAGLTARMVHMTAEEAEAQNPLYADARAAEEAGNLELALEQWELVLKKQPKDQVAKEALARLNMVSRLRGGQNQGPLAEADELFASGQVELAFEQLLTLISENKFVDDELAESARVRILELFTIVGNADPAVRSARGRLATLLF
ncbi:thioredoxin [Gleimia coleocanis DSM 15436]|uniref:Thioredoxin n=1 Tax=Gleimia coleocanis DSM 15436 TaxID=525245 RepID=C0W013_9ACTO|nr:tetratricopeptide repeat protein [Gleimia coleocanis]EEH63872.1 thioredoxin [Gleimia coleocanis DSM 15436]